MNAPLPLLTDDEIRSCRPADDEPGFGAMRTTRGLLPLAALDVKARVVGLFATTTLAQTFVNAHDVPLEATYVFPLPDRAAVTKLVFEVNGRVVDGVLQERAQARRTYDDAIQTGHRASIAEEERPGTFTMRVGNLMPGERATVRLEITGALPYVDGEATYRFPLVVAPRYIPGRALDDDDVGDGVARDTDQVTDASRITPPVLLPGFPNAVRLAIAVELDPAGLPLSSVRSSLHAATANDVAGVLTIDVAPGERADRDFVLRFKLGDDAVRTSLKVLPPDETGAGTFLLTVLPPTTAAQPKPKDVVFVLDRSGSMQGWKMVAARRATARMIDALRPTDRFALIGFDDALHVPPRLPPFTLVDADDQHRFRAVEWLATLSSAGGTEMAAPLARAAQMLAGGYLERDRVLVFVTDGQVGNEAALVKLLGQQLKGARVFALGIDKAVNGAFLNRLAALGGSGHAELVESEERLDEVLERAHRRIDAPIVAELSLQGDGLTIDAQSIAPTRLPDLFAGVPAIVHGRCAGPVGGAVVVRGRGREGPFEERVPAARTANGAVRAAWARARLRDLEDRFDVGREDRGALERRIVETSLTFGVLCRFTAFVAVDRAEVVNKGGGGHRVTQAVETPAGWAEAEEQAKSATRAGRPRAPAPMPARAQPVVAQAPRAAVDEDDAFFEAEPAAAFDEDLADAPAAASAAMPDLAAAKPAPAMRPGGLADALGGLGRAIGGAMDAFAKKKDEAGPGGPPRDQKAAARKEQAPPRPAPSTATGGGSLEDALRALVRERLQPLLVELERRAALDPTERARLVAALVAALVDLVQEVAVAPGLADERRALEEALRILRGAAAARMREDLDAAAAQLARFGPAKAHEKRAFWR